MTLVRSLLITLLGIWDPVLGTLILNNVRTFSFESYGTAVSTFCNLFFSAG